MHAGPASAVRKCLIIGKACERDEVSNFDADAAAPTWGGYVAHIYGAQRHRDLPRLFREHPQVRWRVAHSCARIRAQSAATGPPSVNSSTFDRVQRMSAHMGMFRSRWDSSGAWIYLLSVFRYPSPEPISTTWSFPHQIKLPFGRRTWRPHQYPACRQPCLLPPHSVTP